MTSVKPRNCNSAKLNELVESDHSISILSSSVINRKGDVEFKLEEKIKLGSRTSQMFKDHNPQYCFHTISFEKRKWLSQHDFINPQHSTAQAILTLGLTVYALEQKHETKER